MKNTAGGLRGRVGRPPTFDRAEALRRATLLFWRYGYEATSVSQLTAAMGVTPPSLYGAFGDKKALFFEAARLYASGFGASASGDAAGDRIRAAPTARAAAEGLLLVAAAAFTGRDTPPGCLLASSATNCGPESADVQGALAEVRRRIERRLRAKIALDRRYGFLPADADPTALAALTVGVIQGMSALARDGAKRPKLLAMATAAMRAWPAESKSAATT